MISDHEVLEWLKVKRPDIYQRIFSKSGGRDEKTIITLIDILDKGSVKKP